MLIERSKGLIELSQKAMELKKYTENLQGFKSRQEIIDLAIVELSQLIDALRTFRLKGIIAFDFSPKVEKMLELVSYSSSKFIVDREWIIDNKNFNGKHFQSGIDSLKATLSQQLLQAWNNYLERRLPSTNPEILDLLSRIDDFKVTAQKIRNLNGLIKRDEFPKSQEEFNNIELLIQQLIDAWHSLNASEFPDAVLRFLKASASQEGAPINLLTAEVQAWVIEHHKIAEGLRIRLR
jgi:hypothetical protein